MVATKIAQVLVEVCLIYLIILDWRKAPHEARRRKEIS